MEQMWRSLAKIAALPPETSSIAATNIRSPMPSSRVDRAREQRARGARSTRSQPCAPPASRHCRLASPTELATNVFLRVERAPTSASVSASRAPRTGRCSPNCASARTAHERSGPDARTGRHHPPARPRPASRRRPLRRDVPRRHSSVAGGRGASTAIYFLLQAGEVSRWHTRRCGRGLAPLCRRSARGDDPGAGRPRCSLRLGKDLEAGERPQAVVPAHAWQMARPLGDWTLVGCTVAPAFEFAGFDLAPAGFEPS